MSYITLRYVQFRSVPLHYITLHYITLPKPFPSILPGLPRWSPKYNFRGALRIPRHFLVAQINKSVSCLLMIKN